MTKNKTLLIEKIKALKAEIEAFNANSIRADKFIEIVKRYTDFKELTTPMVNEFIEKVVVHNADNSSGTRVQQVDIYLNFIGRFDAPIIEEEPTQEEINAAELEAKRKYEANRARDREKLRRWRKKQKEKKEIEKAV